MKAKTLQALHVVAKIVQERVHWSQPWKRLVELLVAALVLQDQQSLTSRQHREIGMQVALSIIPLAVHVVLPPQIG